MITIHAERCNGCGACLEVCPHGALYLIDGKARVDEKLCRECEVCVAACPTEAMLISGQVAVSIPSQASPGHPEPHVISVESRPAPVALRTKVLPVVGAALSWAGRELVPRLAYYLLDGLDRQASRQGVRMVGRGGGQSNNRRGSGRQQRRRYRGGRGSSG